MLGLPSATEVKKVIPKKAFFHKFQLNTAEQKEFDAVVRQLVIVNEVSLRTVPALQCKEGSKPVFILAVQLKQESCPEKILQKLCRLINQRLLLVLQCEDKAQLALAFNNRILKNDFRLLSEQQMQLQGTSLDEIFEHLALQVANLQPLAGLTGAAVIAAAARREDLEKQIAVLTKKMFAEKQAHQKLALREQINLIKKELEALQS